MAPKKKKTSIFGRTPQERADARALGRLAAGRDPFKNGKPVKKKAETVKFKPTAKAIAKGRAKIIKARAAAAKKAAPKRPSVVKRATTAVKKVVRTARKSAAKKTQARLRPTAPKRRSRR